ncbi:Rrf2 family transcriptional regulator [Prescottella equi]|uniref:Rrf2 family transcriptional regulator n=1 Tax=Rhodococcus hoagii TaxID=43767 RepID=UPI0013013CB0|nr:Rrf2 family transcriptional regulator [Prescottella equi]
MTSSDREGRRNVDVSVVQRIGPWQVELGWPDDSFQVGPVSITITAAPDATDDQLLGGLSSTVLRQIDFPAARSDWQVQRVVTPKPIDSAKSPKWLSPWTKEEVMNSRAEGLQEALARDGVADGYLALLAEAYVALVGLGERSVAAKLAEMTGRSRDTARQHLHRARKAGMLTSIPGRAGGELTAKAVKAIQHEIEGPDDPEAEWEMAQRLATKMGGGASS